VEDRTTLADQTLYTLQNLHHSGETRVKMEREKKYIGSVIKISH